ncbi:MAG: pseudouridine synthase [bacterium]|nr:pseudouridine synthase [bacterium]
MRPPYWRRIVACLSQLANVVLFNGMPDETISARAYRQNHLPAWAALRRGIDLVFFWQDDHCFRTYKWEQLRRDDREAYR